MNKSDKIRVAVLFGGRSAEHEVSLSSATQVIENLDRQMFEVIPIGIDQSGNWGLGQDLFRQSLLSNTVPALHEEDHPHAPWFTPAWIGKESNKIRVKPQDIIAHERTGALFDVVFPVVHGTLCEDGSLQGLLELANLPYVGSGILGSAINMDKDVSKRLAKAAGILVGPYEVIKANCWTQSRKSILATLKQTYPQCPLFVKPANTGSSIGITKVKAFAELESAIDKAFCYDKKVLVEKGINATELEIAVLESSDEQIDPIISVVGEVRPCSSHDYYSYQSKYAQDGVELFIPAPISDKVAKAAQKLAKSLFQLLECEGMARVDLFLDKVSGEIYFNEINTIPGFTKSSMYPRLMAASGVSYSQLLTHLIQLAIQKHNKKSQLIRHYEE